MLGLAWAYARTGSLPQTAGLMLGMKPVVLALIIHALWGLGNIGLKQGRAKWIFTAAVIAYFYRADEVAILFAAGGGIGMAARIWGG